MENGNLNPIKSIQAVRTMIGPVVMEMAEDAYTACRDADVLVIMTEWNQFRMLDLNRVKELLRRPAIADLRNVYDPGPMRAAGFTYAGVGR